MPHTFDRPHSCVPEHHTEEQIKCYYCLLSQLTVNERTLTTYMPNSTTALCCRALIKCLRPNCATLTERAKTANFLIHLLGRVVSRAAGWHLARCNNQRDDLPFTLPFRDESCLLCCWIYQNLTVCRTPMRHRLSNQNHSELRTHHPSQHADYVEHYIFPSCCYQQ